LGWAGGLPGTGNRRGLWLEAGLGELLAHREGRDRRGTYPDLRVPRWQIGFVELAAVREREWVGPVDLRGNRSGLEGPASQHTSCAPSSSRTDERLALNIAVSRGSAAVSMPLIHSLLHG